MADEEQNEQTENQTPEATEQAEETVSAPEGPVAPAAETEEQPVEEPPAEKPATRKPITRTEKPATEPARRQERRGVVVSDKGNKTIVVKVDVIKSHPKYKKVIRRAVKFHAHDEANTAGVGDTVRIVETRPLSKTKRWRLAEILEVAK